MALAREMGAAAAAPPAVGKGVQRQRASTRPLLCAVALLAAAWLLLSRAQQPAAGAGVVQPRPPALLRGHVNKTSTLSLNTFHPRHIDPCESHKQLWLAAAANGSALALDVAAAAATGTGIAADEAGASAAAAEEQGDGTLLLGQRPCIECNIFLNHTYKYIFIRHAKVGSTTTVAAFKDCKAHPEQPGCMLWGLGSMRQIGDEEALANWRDYFVFTVSRDPWERAVSMYMFLTSWVMADPPDCRTLVDWDRFCGDPLSLARMCARRPECCLSKSGAEQMARHVLDQASCMAPGVGLAVDFVARQEHLDEDLQEVFAAVNVRRDPGVPPLEPPPRVAQALKRKECPGGESALLAEHQPVELKGVINWTGLQAREQYCTTAEYYSGRHAHCVESIGRFFAADVALLGGGRPA